MSETEIHTGRMTVFARNGGEALGDYFARFLALKGIEYSKTEFDECFELDSEEATKENLREFMTRFNGSWRKQTFIISYCDDLIFDFVEHKYHDSLDVSTFTKLEDGSYSFTMSFYNGGTCLPEMLSDAFRKAREK